MACRLRLCLGATAAFAAGLLLTNATCGELRESSESRAGSDRTVIHEWGTFTCLQDEDSEAIGGINVDDEPVPQFVHCIADFLLVNPKAGVPILYQGAPRCHPDVTMRLETPVVYFHPSRDATLPMSMDVEVAFRAGWLSEYFPDAEVVAPGVKGSMRFGPIGKETIGRLMWNDLQVGTDAAGPDTSSHVWLAPRNVQAAGVTSAGGESERYLFYRGVGHLDSPLRVSRDEAGESLILTADFAGLPQSGPAKLVVPAMWLVETRAGKACAFRAIDGFAVKSDAKPNVVGATPAMFNDSDFHADNIPKLCAEMRVALIDDGLYPDEADALLNTWKLSYFESPGLRLFYLLPRAWTDHVLPMSVSPEAKLVRTMVGRIEIVTPEQRRLLAEIAARPTSNAQWLLNSLRSDSVNPPEQPADYRAYQQLGRFRNALVLDELKRRPTAALKAFIEGYGLRSYQPAE